MAQTIKLKRSASQGAVPTTSDLELGEVAINTYDGKLYIKKNVSGTESIVEVGASSGSGQSYTNTLTATVSTSINGSHALKAGWPVVINTDGTATYPNSIGNIFSTSIGSVIEAEGVATIYDSVNKCPLTFGIEGSYENLYVHTYLMAHRGYFTWDQLDITQQGDNAYVDGYVLGAAYDTAESKFAVVWKTGSASTAPVKVIVGSWDKSTHTITSGSITSFPDTVYGRTFNMKYDPSSGYMVFVYGDSGNNNYPTVCAAQISNNSISFGTPQVIQTTSIYGTNSKIAMDIVTEATSSYYGKVYAAWATSSTGVSAFDGLPQYSSGIQVTINNTTTSTLANGGATSIRGVWARSGSSDYFLVYSSDGTAIYANKYNLTSGLGSSTTVHNNSNSTSTFNVGVTNSSASQMVLTYVQGNSLYYRTIATSSTAVVGSIGTEYELEEIFYNFKAHEVNNHIWMEDHRAGFINYPVQAPVGTLKRAGNPMLVSYNSYDGSTLTDYNFIGFAKEDAAEGATVTIDLPGSIYEFDSLDNGKGTTIGNGIYLTSGGGFSTSSADGRIYVGQLTNSGKIATSDSDPRVSSLWEDWGSPTSLSNSLIPDTDVTYDLGSSSKRWRDLYLSGNTIDLGGQEISTDGSTLSFNGQTLALASEIGTRFSAVASGAISDGETVVINTNGTVSSANGNLTQENFVGISSAAYADGDTAVIQSAGSLDDAQVGLTPGQAYYVQDSGILATTPGSTYQVFAGIAISTTQLLIGGNDPNPPSASGSIPAQSGNSGKFLTTDGTSVSWALVDYNLDGGRADSVFTSIQYISGGTASG